MGYYTLLFNLQKNKYIERPGKNIQQKKDNCRR